MGVKFAWDIAQKSREKLEQAQAVAIKELQDSVSKLENGMIEVKTTVKFIREYIQKPH